MSLPASAGEPAPGQQQPAVEVEQSEQTRRSELEKDEAAIVRIEQLMQSRDDTSRFVALALLKAVLDNETEPVSTESVTSVTSVSSATSATLLRLWEAVPAKFLDRLLRSQADQKDQPGQADQTDSSVTPAPDTAKRDLAVAVLFTFATRLWADTPVPGADADNVTAKLTGRIPLLVASLSALGPSSLVPALQTLVTLVSRRPGAAVFNSTVVGADLDPLTHLAPAQPLVLDVLLRAWAWGLWEDWASPPIAQTMDGALTALAAAFRDTDAVTLLDFVARLLRQTGSGTATSDILPPNLAWLLPVVGFIRRLAACRPTAAARAASTHAAAALLRAYPQEVPALLFSDRPTSSSSSSSSSSTSSSTSPSSSSSSASSSPPFAYLFVHLLLVDIRASLPGLLAQLNTPAYAATANRLAAAYDVLSAFVGYLMRSLDDDADDDGMSLVAVLMPDRLLRLRAIMAETLSATAEYLRDRWDAATAGALGLHPDARPGNPTTTDSGPLLAWDAVDADSVVSRDPLVLAALRALALWLREDDGADLRREATALADMLLDLYRESTASSSSASSLDFRSAVLVALEGITAPADVDKVKDNDDDDDHDPQESAVDILLQHDAWPILTKDLLAILFQPPPSLPSEATRGIDIVRVLLPIVENARPGIRQEWMDFVTGVAAWSGPDSSSSSSDPTVAEFRVAVFQLLTALLSNAPPAVCRRYTLSIAAIASLAEQMRPSLTAVPGLVSVLDDILSTLNTIRSSFT